MSNFHQNITPNVSKTNLKVVKSSNGEEISIVRPYAVPTKSTDEIIGDLVNNFSYRTVSVKASESELNAVNQAFGSSLASELINTYDGSNLVSDSQQDLIGERYLAEQIKLIEQQQRESSVLNRWSHLLYEGEKYDDRQESNANCALASVTESLKSSRIKLSTPEIETNNLNILDDLLEMVRANNAARQKETEDGNNGGSYPALTETEKNSIESDLQRAVEAAARVDNCHTQSSKYQTHAEETVNEFQNSSFRRSELGCTGNPQHYRRSSSNHTNASVQQPAEYLPQLSSSNLNAVSLDAYNSPQFKLMLEQMMKPMEMPVPEETTFPGDWPSAEKIAMLSEPIYIPAPLPIVIPAPNMSFAHNSISSNNNQQPDELTKSYVTNYPKTVPSIASDQAHYQNFGIRQINM